MYPKECLICQMLILDMKSHLKRFHDKEIEEIEKTLDILQIEETPHVDETPDVEEKKYNLIFDLETTGLPNQLGFNMYYEPHQIKHYDSSRVIELGYMICSKEGEIIKKKSYLIKHDEDIEITNSFIHNITKEMIDKDEDSKNINEALDIFLNDLENVDTIIAHNINFDYNILLSECYRLNKDKLIQSLKSKKRECTMQMGTLYMKSKKSIKLVELFKKLFKMEIQQKHRALYDTDLCGKCYYKLQEKLISTDSDSDSENDKCNFILTRGKNKGNSCNKKTYENANHCKKHTK